MQLALPDCRSCIVYSPLPPVYGAESFHIICTKIGFPISMRNPQQFIFVEVVDFHAFFTSGSNSLQSSLTLVEAKIRSCSELQGYVLISPVEFPICRPESSPRLMRIFMVISVQPGSFSIAEGSRSMSTLEHTDRPLV